MAAYQTIELARFAPSPGDGRRLELELEPGSFELGGHRYDAEPAEIPARLEVSRTASGYALHLSFDAHLDGPCMRCLGGARAAVAVDAREVDQPGTDDEELRSPYVTEGELDLAAWAHDALLLALPQQLLCRPECAGLCPVCGESLNDAAPGAHDHPREPDPRWAKLRELRNSYHSASRWPSRRSEPPRSAATSAARPIPRRSRA